MQRILACLGTLALLVSIAPPSAAQEQQGVVLSLVRQTPWNGAKSPEVDVTFRATNTTSQTLSNLSAVITLHQHVQSVSQYELSLTEDPTLPQGLAATVTKPLQGTLPPNGSRTFTVSRNLKFLPNLASLVYPMEIQFGSGSRSLATLRTPVVYLVEKPKTPLGLAWTFALDALAHVVSADQVEMSAMPFSDPLLPALGNSGLGGDVDTQIQRGQSLLHNRFRQATLDANVMRPPQSAIDATSLQQLSRQGT